jgi:hypothetical protein
VQLKAAHFDGNSYLTIEDFPGGKGFTMAAWIRTTGTDYQYVVAKGNNFGGSFYLRLERDGRPRVGFLPVDRLNSVYADGSFPVNDGKWRHVAGMLDGKALLLHVDGRLAGKLELEMPFTVTLPKYERFTYIGAFDVAEDDGKPDAMFFKGEMDDVRLLDGPVPVESIAKWAERK